MDFSAYKKFLEAEYPSAYEFVRERDWRPPLFFETVPLPLPIYKRIEAVIRSLFQLKKREDYQKSLFSPQGKEADPGQIPKTALKSQTSDSVLMAYDFHIQEGVPKLIEVNTNGAGFLLVNSLYQLKNLPFKPALESLKKSFQSEWEKFTGDPAFSPPGKTALIDKDPLNQKMAVEFFMFKDFFKSMGWPFEICDSRFLKSDERGLYAPPGGKIDFAYNRLVDFYFENHPALASAYTKGLCAISPHPREYFLLSDKDRLCGWPKQTDKWPELRAIRQNLLFSKALNSQNKEELWKDKKKYFFKIRQGFGGKLAYRGSSLSRKKFEELCQFKSMAQRHIPPSIFKDSKGEEWKMDFRAFAYEDQIQQLTARCYKGQTANFRAEGSGFAAIALTAP